MTLAWRGVLAAPTRIASAPSACARAAEPPVAFVAARPTDLDMPTALLG